MKISLRTFFVLCILIGVLVSLAAREYLLSIPSSFPVTYSTRPIVDVDVPAEVVVWRKRSVRRATIAAEKAYDQVMLKRSPTDEYLLEELLNDPNRNFSYLVEQGRKVITANRERMLKKKSVWLSKRTDHKTLIGAAHVLAVLNDRSGFDQAIKRLPEISEGPQGALLVQHLACACPTDLAIESKELMQAVRGIFNKEPSERLAWVLERSGDKTARLEYHRNQVTKTKKPTYYRTRSLNWLTENAPSEEVFELVKALFNSPNILRDHDAPKLLGLYLQAENPSWRAEALDIAVQLVETPVAQRGGYHVYPYHNLICAHGGVEFVDYFKKHIKDSHCQYAMCAMGRFLPRDEYLAMLREKDFFSLYLGEEGDNAIPFLREQFSREKSLIYVVANHQAGTKDPETIAAIKKQLTPGTSFYGGVMLIDALETLGADVNRDEMMDLLATPQYNPKGPDGTDRHWLVNRITNEDFWDFVNQYAAQHVDNSDPTPITVEEVFDKLGILENERGEGKWAAGKLMEGAGIAKEFAADEWAFESLGFKARNMTKLFAEDFPFDSVSFEDPHLRFATSKRVFEVALINSGDWYDPVAIADVLNSILAEHSDSPKRLYCFDMADEPYYAITIAYLDPSFVEDLGESYAVYPMETRRVRQKPVNKQSTASR